MVTGTWHLIFVHMRVHHTYVWWVDGRDRADEYDTVRPNSRRPPPALLSIRTSNGPAVETRMEPEWKRIIQDP